MTTLQLIGISAVAALAGVGGVLFYQRWRYYSLYVYLRKATFNANAREAAFGKRYAELDALQYANAQLRAGENPARGDFSAYDLLGDGENSLAAQLARFGIEIDESGGLDWAKQRTADQVGYVLLELATWFDDPVVSPAFSLHLAGVCTPGYILRRVADHLKTAAAITERSEREFKPEAEQE